MKLLLVIVSARVVSCSALNWPFSHLIVVFPFVKMDVRTIQLVVFAICLETRKRERVVFGDKETAKVVIRK